MGDDALRRVAQLVSVQQPAGSRFHPDPAPLGDEEGAIGAELVESGQTECAGTTSAAFPPPGPVGRQVGFPQVFDGSGEGLQVFLPSGLAVQHQEHLQHGLRLGAGDRRRLEDPAPGGVHAAVVLLSPGRLGIGHLGQQEEVAPLLGHVPVTRLPVDSRRLQEGVDDVQDGVVVEGVVVAVVGTRPFARPRVGIRGGPGGREAGIGDIPKSLRPRAVGILGPGQLIQGEEARLVDLGVLEFQFPIHPHQEPERALGDVVVQRAGRP